MKIEITVVPKFHIPLEKPHVELLQKLAAMHYDWTCKKAGVHGGFIYGWHNHVSFVDFGEVSPVTADSRELDTCLKILEMPPALTQNEMDMIREMRAAFCSAFSLARAFVHGIRTST